jgi:hypothetical protein
VSRRMLFDRGSAGVALGSCRRTKSQESWGAAVRMEGRETEPMRDSVSSEIQNGPIRLAGWLSSPPRIALAAPVAALFLAFAAGLAPAQASAATPAYPGLTGGSAVSTTTGTATAIGSDFDITDATSVGWSSVTATVTTDTGTLTADAGDSGATVSVASNTITIEGAIADVEKVLNSDGTAYARITQSSAGAAEITVAVEPSPEFTLGGTPTYFFSGNGHYYRLNTSFRDWTQVNTDAQGTTVAGADGYVGVVRDEAEDDFLRATVLPDVTGGDVELRQVWLGAERGPNDLPVACQNGGSTIKAFRWVPGTNAPAGDQNVDVSPACSADQTDWTPWYSGQPTSTSKTARAGAGTTAFPCLPSHFRNSAPTPPSRRRRGP